jgi:DedD protein
MAFFKFRKNGAEQTGSTPAPESLDVLRKRARHRLIGAAALVLLGVVGFPMLFDSQPRPVAVDIAIDIPDKAKAAPLSAAPASAAPAAPVSEPAAVPDAATAAKQAPVVVVPAPDVVKAEPKVEPKAEAKPEVKAEPKPEPKAAPKADGKADSKASAKPDEKTATSGKAQALLEGKDPAKAAAPRYAVQVGAFADAQKAHEVRAKLEKAGIKTYTQVVTTADGKRTRVRVGPWESESEADKTAEKIKKLNLSAAVLTL